MGGMRAYLGIDPGKDGGIVLLLPEQNKVYKWVTPQEGAKPKTTFDKKGYNELIKKIKEKFPTVVGVIEEVHSIFGVSASANWSFGNTFGMQEMSLVANNIPYHLVPPKTWQKLLWAHSDKVMVHKKGNKKESVDTKATSLRTFKRLFPNEDFTASTRSSVFHNGMVDAALLAEYARRMNF